MNKDTKILIIDDNPQDIQTAMSILSQEGYSLLYAQDGLKGIEIAKSQNVSLILLDTLMQKMDGYKVCKKLKSTDNTKDIPIIFLTAKDNEEDIVKGFDYESVDYITKPFYEKVLLKRVENHLRFIKTKKELKNLNKELLHRVQKKLEKIRQKDQILLQQAKMASMGEMIANITHQWKQPLGAISSAVISIKTAFGLDKFDLNSEEEAKKCEDYVEKKLDDIEIYIEMLSDTIDDFKNFFKPQKKREIFDLEECVQKSIKIFSASISNHEITLINEVASIMIVSYCNELIHVLLNLLNNAKDAVILDKNKKNKKILISSFVKDDFINISVKDNGIGINDKILDRIFEPYFTTKEKYDGTGIGLYMTKEIVQKHLHGKLNVKKLDKGTEFVISLPIEREI